MEKKKGHLVGGALATASGSIKFARVRSFPPGQNKYNLILISWIITKYRTQFGLSDGDVRGVAGGVVLAEPSWARAWFSRTTCGDLPLGRRWKGPRIIVREVSVKGCATMIGKRIHMFHFFDSIRFS